MAKVICTLENASDEISGVKFKKHPDGAGMVSEDISDEQAARFASIPGYELVGAKKADSATEKAAAEAAAAELEALTKRAEELGIKVKGNWKADRIRAEIAEAERIAAEKGAQGKEKTGGDGNDQGGAGTEQK